MTLKSSYNSEMDKKFALGITVIGIIILILLSAATVYEINEKFEGQGIYLFLLAALCVLAAYFIENIKNKIFNKFKRA